METSLAGEEKNCIEVGNLKVIASNENIVIRGDERYEYSCMVLAAITNGIQ